MSEKRLPCATTGVLACSLVLDHVLDNANDDEVRRHRIMPREKLITNSGSDLYLSRHLGNVSSAFLSIALIFDINPMHNSLSDVESYATTCDVIVNSR